MNYSEDVNWSVVVEQWPGERHKLITPKNLRFRFETLAKERVPLGLQKDFHCTIDFLIDEFVKPYREKEKSGVCDSDVVVGV